MPSAVTVARLRAELAAALQRREDLQHRWAVATLTSSSGGERVEDLDVELARVEAVIVELEERLAGAAAPAPAELPPAPAPAGDACPPEFLDVHAAAALLGTTAKALEGLRRRGTGPAFIRLGKRVRYRRADLLSTVQETVQGKPSKP